MWSERLAFWRRRRASESTLARISLARHNEEIVVAEGALAAERQVAIVRLVLMVAVWVSQMLAISVVGLQGMPRDALRGVVAGLYSAFAVFVIVFLRKRKPYVRGAQWGPLGFSLIDLAFFTFMGVRTWTVERMYQPQVGAALFAVIICFSVARMSWVHIVVSTFFACACYLFLSVHQAEVLGHLRTEFMVCAAFVALATLVAFTRLRTRRMFLDLRRRDMLTRFLPKQVADRVMQLGAEALAPVQRDVTVMFTDIRDFTTLSEHLPPGVVLSFLDDYFGQMSQVVKGRDGIVNKFLGDGMLAFWGVPERLEDHAGQACRAALDMRRVVEEMNLVRKQKGAPPIRIGVGIHTGPVAAGMLGGTEQHEYTVIGDAVNLTSRIEGLTKTYAVDILVSESTWEFVGERFAGERVGECHVKGRAEPVVVYRLDGVRAKEESEPARVAARA